MKNRKDLFSKMAYACGDIYGGGAFIIVGLLLLVYLTNVENFSGTLAGVIVFTGKAWDAITDPFMGQLSDRTRSRFGRRRIWFLLGSLPVFFSWVMLWYGFGISGTTAKFIYYTLSFIFFSTSFTIVMVPYNAILSDMVPDYNRRSAFTGMRLGFSAAAAILCAIFPALITGAYSDPKQGYLIMGITFGVVFAISWLIVFWGTWENRTKPSPSVSLKDWLFVFKNRSFRIYVTVFIFCQMAIDTVMTLAVYFLTVSLKKPALFVPIMGSILVTQLVFIAVFSQVALKKGKTLPAYISAGVWIAASMAIVFLTPATPDLVVIAICSLIGIGGAGCNLFSWSALPDIADVDELITGRRREGLYSGVSTFLRKLSGGVVVGVLGIFLDVIGYSEEAVRSGNISTTTDWGIRMLFCAIPVAFLVFALLFLRKYKLGRQEFTTMSLVLTRYRNGGSDIPLEEDELSVCRQLTGLKGDRFFGNS
ncbi:MFS transporter [Lentimicrobium sp.]|uniref:MFS transporter n=1 Tax=Lentimicrobium sp. TaxID=2034841 RepID=UPI002D08C8C4|nr:MFS transporter [Lentimicrobium sp.]HPJ77902.1 MFS transporter [Prolixibacteraceae bacterium]HRW70408.1 MFS transporter [Lentimicrobium sp.]